MPCLFVARLSMSAAIDNRFTAETYDELECASCMCVCVWGGWLSRNHLPPTQIFINEGYLKGCAMQKQYCQSVRVMSEWGGGWKSFIVLASQHT